MKGTADTAVGFHVGPQRRVLDGDASDGRSFVLADRRADGRRARPVRVPASARAPAPGVAWRGAAPDVAGTASDAGRIRAQGMVTNSVFAHNHFGAYTQEAQGMHWSGNTFSDRGVRVEPDYFEQLLRCGGQHRPPQSARRVIFSRGCLRNVLRGNTPLPSSIPHGFMIDDGRSTASATAEIRLNPSDDNLVTGNTAYDNAGSGVEIEGGSGNVVSGNHLTGNDIGVRIKDRALATVSNNTIDPASVDPPSTSWTRGAGVDRRQPHLWILGGETGPRPRRVAPRWA